MLNQHCLWNEDSALIRIILLKRRFLSEGRVGPGYCLGFGLCVPFSDLTQMDWWQEVHPALKSSHSANPSGSIPEQVEDLRGN